MIPLMPHSRPREAPVMSVSPSGTRCMKIDDRAIGPECPPYVIAEISNNHLGDVDRACRLIEMAAWDRCRRRQDPDL